ncbi:MAG TPA: GTPase HflX [Elusimicrobia bacterium]|nr:GTPase HflX [Elusimicrobiota bacterium]HBT60804.1 GTPase HflX [Elusimicrobiota bacterium]
MRHPERVVLVGVGLKPEAELMAASLSELHRLVETAGGAVVDTLSQCLPRYHAGTLIGSGKIQEIAAAARARQASTVVFDREISPAQQKALEAAIRAKILDRTRLILDIFARRARTSEGRLQVELAQLSYMLPRLTGAWRSYSQQVGGIGTRGPGERQLEYERRHIQFRIKHLRGELERVRSSRMVRRERRLAVPVPQVALIGYTNVGKSTLLNTLTAGIPQKDTRVPSFAKAARARLVYADDKLFATLDPTARRVRLPEGSWAVMTDTVGFIRRLPTTLIAAFRATLEEAVMADCLLVVADASASESEAQQAAVAETLGELGARDVAQVRLFNKVDLIDAQARRDLERRYPEAIFVSAATGEGVAQALAAVQETLSKRWLLRELELPQAMAFRRIEAIRSSSQVLSQTAVDDKIRFRLRLTAENWDRLQKKLAPAKENP